MAITRTGNNLGGGVFVPQIWSKKLIRKYYSSSVCNIICNSDWQGEILAQGNVVQIRQRPDVFVNPTTVNQKINWQDIVDISQTLQINYAFDAAIKIDNIDAYETDINLQAELVDEISNRLRLAIETTVLGGAYSTATSKLTIPTGGTAWSVAGSPLAWIANAQASLNILNVPVEDRWLLLHPTMVQYLIQQTALYALNAGTPKGALQMGYVGELAGFSIYQSPLVTGAGTVGSPFNAMCGHRDAITLATQFTQFEANVPLQDYYGKGIRAQNCFGYKTVKPDALVWLSAVMV
jgi:hypothetical protein